MTEQEFAKIVAEEFPGAIPEKFKAKIKNLAFLVEQEPSLEVREEEGLGPGETLLGYYKGVPHTARGDGYGVGATYPDTITLYQLPIQIEAQELGGGEENVRKVVRDTIWHEVAHHFGMDEGAVRRREQERGV
jgi:predicted Zn-dependent protease with MMP-like domain